MSEALDAYLGGSLEKAISLQRRIVSTNDPKKRPNARDFLLLGMFLDADKRVADAISALQEKLAANRLTAPLFDTDRFRRHIEGAYTTMWEIWQRGRSRGASRSAP